MHIDSAWHCVRRICYFHGRPSKGIYCACLQLEQLGADVDSLLKAGYTLQGPKLRKIIISTFALRKACSIDDDAMHLGYAAQIVHKEMLIFI